ncbi:phage major capsid protein, partial [Bacillus cereus]
MLDLGPSWLDRYVRTVLVESIAIALEAAIVAGTGKDQPIGMIKDLDNVKNGEHADKKKVELSDFTPKTLGKEVMKPL